MTTMTRIMKATRQSENSKGRWTSQALAAGAFAAGMLALLAPVTSPAINAVPAPAAAVKPAAASQPGGATLRYSAGIADILKMTDAKVDPEVIKAYVRNSPTAYSLSAAEIIALKEHGISPEIIMALIQRGGELRAQAMRAGQPAANPPVQPAYPSAVTPYTAPPAYDYSTPPAYADYSYVYPGYDYGCYGYGYGWPYCGLSFGFGGYPYCGYYGYPYYCGYYGYGRGYYGYGRGYGGYLRLRSRLQRALGCLRKPRWRFPLHRRLQWSRSFFRGPRRRLRRRSRRRPGPLTEQCLGSSAVRGCNPRTATWAGVGGRH